MLIGAAIAVVLAAAIGTAVSYAGESSPASKSTATTSTEVAPTATTTPTEVAPTATQLDGAALRIAAESGEPTPSNIEEAEGTLGTAINAAGPGVTVPKITDPQTGEPWASSKVDVVTMHGQFSEKAGPVPRHGIIPTGTVMTLIVDAKSGVIVGRLLSNTAVDLNAISPSVTTLGG